MSHTNEPSVLNTSMGFEIKSSNLFSTLLIKTSAKEYSDLPPANLCIQKVADLLVLKDYAS